MCSTNHPQGHVEKRVHADRPENPGATEGRTTKKKNKHLMKGNEQTKKHRGGDRHTILKSCMFHISDKRPFYKTIGIALINLGKIQVLQQD